MARRPSIGQPAPRIELPVHTTDRKVRRWSLDEPSAHGRAVVLVFHRHIHCLPCSEHAAAVSRRLDDITGENGMRADVVLITFTTNDELDTYRRRRKLSFPILVDADRSTYSAYGLDRGSFAAVWGWPTIRRYWQILRLSGPGSLRDLSSPTEDTRQLGGDFVVAPDGTLSWGHWSSGPADRPSVDMIVAAVERATAGPTQ